MDMTSTTQFTGVVSLQMALLLALAFAWVGMVRHTALAPVTRDVMLGVMTGGGALVGMLASSDFPVYIDVRAAIVAMAAAFGGFLPGGITALIVIAGRWVITSDGAVTSAAYVITAFGIGLWCYRVYGPRLTDCRWQTFLAIGVLVAVAVLFWVLLLPHHLVSDILPLLATFVLFVYPLATMLMGGLMARELRRHRFDQLMSREYDILQTALQSVLTPVAVTRLDTSQFLYANQALCDMLRIPCENLHRQKARLFYADPAERADLMARIHATGSVTEYELTLYRADGVKIETLVNMQRIMFDGEPALASSLIDVTQRKKQAQAAFDIAMQQAQMRMISEVIQNISHDVNTPLSTMQTSLYLLERATDPERQRRHLYTLSDQIERLTRIHQQLFEMARVEHADSYEEQPIRLDTLLQTVRDQMARKAQSRDILLDVMLDTLPTQGAIHGDLRQLTQALVHIVENALYYTPEHGSVSVSAYIIATDTPQAVIEVTDTGAGIPPEHLPHVFERFYRVDDARRTDTGGAGLGLSIAQKIVEDHQGRIEAASPPGEGCTFTVMLPYVPQVLAASNGMLDPMRPQRNPPVA